MVGNKYFNVQSGAVKSGIAYQRPPLTGQTTSYRTGDDGWHLANGTYDYTPPTNPTHIAELNTSSLYSFVMLKNNNVFGNKYRFTSINGGYNNPSDGNYYTGGNVVTDFATEFTNGIVIDNLTGLAWFRPDQVSRNWDLSINNIHGVPTFGYDDWRLCNKNEYNTLLNSESNGGTTYRPVLDIVSTSTSMQSWTSTTRRDNTSEAMWWALYSSQRLLTAAKTVGARQTYCRNWFN